MEQDFKYTVCTWRFTYNQSSYIEDALNSFAKQETSFPIVNVIIDDSSMDGEQDVLQKWAIDNLDFSKEGYSCSINKPYDKLILGHHKKNNNSDFAILLLKENHYQSGRDKDKYAYMSEWTNNEKY